MKTLIQFNINSTGCNYELWLNGIRIDIQMSNHSIVYNLPVNQWILNGENKLELSIFPFENQEEILDNAYFKLTVEQGTSNNEDFVKSSELLKLSTPPFSELKNKSPQIKLGIFKISESFDVNFLYVNGIFNSLNKLSITKEELIRTYKTLINLFEERSLDDIILLMKYKIIFFSYCYQDLEQDEIERQKFFLNYLFSKSVEPIDFEKYDLKLYLDGKIACLENKLGKQPIIFTNPEDDMLFLYPFYFGMIGSNSELSIVL
jgi:hypothetical protein